MSGRENFIQMESDIEASLKTKRRREGRLRKFCENNLTKIFLVIFFLLILVFLAAHFVLKNIYNSIQIEGLKLYQKKLDLEEDYNYYYCQREEMEKKIKSLNTDLENLDKEFEDIETSNQLLELNKREIKQLIDGIKLKIEKVEEDNKKLTEEIEKRTGKKTTLKKQSIFI